MQKRSKMSSQTGKLIGEMLKSNKVQLRSRGSNGANS